MLKNLKSRKNSTNQEIGMRSEKSSKIGRNQNVGKPSEKSQKIGTFPAKSEDLASLVGLENSFLYEIYIEMMSSFWNLGRVGFRVKVTFL